MPAAHTHTHTERDRERERERRRDNGRQRSSKNSNCPFHFRHLITFCTHFITSSLHTDRHTHTHAHTHTHTPIHAYLYTWATCPDLQLSQLCLAVNTYNLATADCDSLTYSLTHSLVLALSPSHTHRGCISFSIQL